MNKVFFRLPTRIPQLYFGAPAAPRKMSGQEKLADGLYGFLVIGSYLLFIIGGVGGYLFNGLYGSILFAMLGYGSGVWMRRSLGMRGLKPTTGFFTRMRERAQGSKAGLLEGVLERLSGHTLTQPKCRAVILAREKAVKQLKQSSSTSEQSKILADLEKNVQRILYS